MNKRSTQEQEQELISRSQFQKQIHLLSWKTTDIHPDLGEDFLIRVYEGGISTGLSFYVQLKSVRQIEKYQLRSGEISYPLDVKDLLHWEGQIPPVYLIVWDVTREIGWWLSIDDGIAKLDKTEGIVWRARKKIHVHLPFLNVLNKSNKNIIRYKLADQFFPIISHGRNFHIQATITIPQTPAGKAKMIELDRHITAGDPINIDSQYINKLELPLWWRRIYGEIDLRNMFLYFGPAISEEIFPVQVDFFSNESTYTRLPYVELKQIKAGEEEATFSNEHQKLPVLITIVVNKRTKHYQFSFSYHLANVDGPTALQIVSILGIMASRGFIRISFLKTGESDQFPISGKFPQPPLELVKFAENLCFIQQRTGVIIKMPNDGSFSNEDYLISSELVSILRTGELYKIGGNSTVELSKSKIELFRRNYDKEKPVHIQITDDNAELVLLNIHIPLGPVTHFLIGYWDTSEEQLDEWLKQANQEDYLMIKFIKAELRDEYLNWKPR